uniref:Poly [ADP-ribose] polymerase n=1 Tax=Euplotes crassus TaxID=5936 RepID=A0A7S3KSA1_EUPCR
MGGSGPLNANLMFADCGHNNNKFYIIQGLKTGSNYYLWSRWGRVGVDGQIGKLLCRDLAHLTSEYNKKRSSKVKKGYTEIEIDYEEESKEEQPKKKSKKKQNDSTLDKSVQDLINFIFDMKLIEKSVVKIGLNVKKLPLGKLSEATLKEGYSYLKKIENELAKKKSNSSKLSELSSEFYRHIPHDFGFKPMSQFIIKTQEMLKEKLGLVESLRDIKIAAEINKQAENSDSMLSQIDQKYQKMNCKIEPFTKKDKHYKDITSTLTTAGYGNLQIIDSFKVARDGESKKFKKNIGNRKLLWHGSGFANWGGILSQGLRIAPPEAPCAGYNFGKGIYFADIVSKSIPYTRYYSSNNTCILALCDVACGKQRELTSSSYNAMNLPKGTHSTFAVGSREASKQVKVDGSMAQIGPFNQTPRSPSWGSYSEYIVYDVDQVEIKYLFKCKVA